MPPPGTQTRRLSTCNQTSVSSPYLNIQPVDFHWRTSVVCALHYFRCNVINTLAFIRWPLFVCEFNFVIKFHLKWALLCVCVSLNIPNVLCCLTWQTYILNVCFVHIFYIVSAVPVTGIWGCSVSSASIGDTTVSSASSSHGQCTYPPKPHRSS